ncbi:flagellar export chaperone FlgN [bacterium]|nr:flagellar export chaperone FlgN [bacterium]
MSSGKELGEALAGCLKEVSSLLGHANMIALKQRDALTANNAEDIVLTCTANEEILRRISEADRRAAAVAAELAVSAGLDPDNSDQKSLAMAAGITYCTAIEAEMQSISALAGKLRRANEVNNKLLRNGMEIITECLRTIADDRGPAPYSKDAHFQPCQPLTLSLDLRV